MTQRKKVEKVKVCLSCILSGEGESWGPGVAEIDKAEADRLIALGVAEAVDKK